MDSGLKITFIGHSTVLLSFKGTNILSDPLFVNRILLVKRKLKAGMEVDKLPEISTITISHAHTDHMNIPSLKKFPFDTKIIVTPNSKKILTRKGFSNVSELENWETVQNGDFRITSVPVNHVSGRFFPWEKTGVASYVFRVAGKTILIAGDIDFGPLDIFNEIRTKFAPDIVMLPVGGMREVDYYNKRQGKKGVHIDPETAYEAFKLSGAKYIIPIHWGAISIAKGPKNEAPLRLLSIAEKDNNKEKVKILNPGESWSCNID